MRAIAPVVGFSMAALALGGCGGNAGEPAPTATVTVTESASNSQSSHSTTTSSAPTKSTTPSTRAQKSKATRKSSAGQSSKFTMPNLVGMKLQRAQDTLQSVGSYVLDQTDAAGLDRWQIDDTNWRVCSQKPAPGTKTPLEATVQLASVKLDENCP